MLSLESWEEKTQLSDVQKQTVHDLQEACIDLPLPSSWVTHSLLYDVCNSSCKVCQQMDPFTHSHTPTETEPVHR